MSRGPRPRGSAPRDARRSRSARLLRTSVLGLLVALSASACSVNSLPRFGFPSPITKQGDSVMELWKGSATAGLAVGVVVWGMMFWAAFAYRKRSDELPRQVRYNIPIEVLYTALPLVAIVVLFYYTAVVENREDTQTPKVDMTIGVVGFQWNWQFNYVNQGVQITGRPGEPAVLVLPTDEKIRVIESSPDVIHSWWVPEFLFKRDVIPGRANQFQIEIKPAAAGHTYVGRCAELCGVDHDRMDFFVKVLSKQDYATWLQGVKSGQSSAQALAGLGQQLPAGTPQAGTALPALGRAGDTASTAHTTERPRSLVLRPGSTA